MSKARSVVQGYFRGGAPSRPALTATGATAGAAAGVAQRVGNGEAFPLPAALSRFGGGGEALPAAVQRKMESYFGASFADVRVHVGREAPAIGALAFTHGSDLYFAPGHYNPASAQGQQLIGHELAHVVQQRAGRVRNPFGSGVAVVVDRGLEAEADRMGLAASVHREPAPPAAATGRLPARAAAAAGSVQPMSFARFTAYGFLTNWGSYNTQENALLALETQVTNFYEGLHFLTKKRDRSKDLKRRLDRVRSANLAASQYAATTLELQRIEAGLEAERKRQYLEIHGHPENPVLGSLYSGGINDQAWLDIVTRIPNQEKGYLKKGFQGHQLVDELFRSFCSQGFRYRTFGGVSGLLGNNRGNTAEGSCLALARAFADVLNSYEIEAEPESVRDEEDGKRFIVKLDKFIDPAVTGNIYHQGSNKRGYYMFSNHTAVWVKSKGRYYDPMAVARYGSLNGFIECELQTDQAEDEFFPTTAPRTLCTGFQWKLVRAGGASLPGGFVRLNLVRDDG